MRFSTNTFDFYKAVSANKKGVKSAKYAPAFIRLATHNGKLSVWIAENRLETIHFFQLEWVDIMEEGEATLELPLFWKWLQANKNGGACDVATYDEVGLILSAGGSKTQLLLSAPASTPNIVAKWEEQQAKLNEVPSHSFKVDRDQFIKAVERASSLIKGEDETNRNKWSGFYSYKGKLYLFGTNGRSLYGFLVSDYWTGEDKLRCGFDLSTVDLNYIKNGSGEVSIRFYAGWLAIDEQSFDQSLAVNVANIHDGWEDKKKYSPLFSTIVDPVQISKAVKSAALAGQEFDKVDDGYVQLQSKQGEVFIFHTSEQSVSPLKKWESDTVKLVWLESQADSHSSIVYLQSGLEYIGLLSFLDPKSSYTPSYVIRLAGLDFHKAGEAGQVKEAEPAEPEPVKEVKPAEPVKQSEPVKIAEPAEPVKPAEPAEQPEPVKIAEPVKIVKPAEPEPVKQVKQPEPVKPVKSEPAGQVKPEPAQLLLSVPAPVIPRSKYGTANIPFKRTPFVSVNYTGWNRVYIDLFTPARRQVSNPAEPVKPAVSSAPLPPVIGSRQDCGTLLYQLGKIEIYKDEQGARFRLICGRSLSWEERKALYELGWNWNRQTKTYNHSLHKSGQEAVRKSLELFMKKAPVIDGKKDRSGYRTISTSFIVPSAVCSESLT